MGVSGMMTIKKRYLIELLAIVLFLGLVATSVFVYLPINVTISGTTIPVKFATGSNAGGTDLGGNTISVTLGSKSMSAKVTLHPTYEYTYYEDVLRIVNDDDSNPHYIAIRVKTTISGLETAQMIIHLSSGDKIINLNSEDTSEWYEISASESAQVDFFFKISEDSPLPSGTILLELIYSPESSTPSGSAPSHP